jgi:hypothetical protein
MSLPVSHLFEPARARRIVLEPLAPTPPGTAPAQPPFPFFPLKDPADVLDYEVDFGPLLAGNPGDGIGAITVTIAPNNPGDLTLNSASANGTSALLWLASGQSGTVYTVTVAITTLAGRSFSRSVLLPCYSLSSLPTPPNALLTTGGLVLTDQNGNPILVTT